ncbi:hypothetical protein [Aliiroseovarius sp. 2305UL8-7]|uniref:hypothetical protein n=1 Tax=Aliiroseovarius conchicola TaxID=3121637 RepID=UPI003529AF76
MKQLRKPLTGTPLPPSSASGPAGPLHPADELAALRRARVQIDAREQVLLDHFRDLGVSSRAGTSDLRGTSHRIDLIQHQKQVLDITRLPQTIVSNAAYYRTQRSVFVTTRRLEQDHQSTHILTR